MKTRTQTSNVKTHGIGATTSFSIATTGKAFRSLIDSVYTDKIKTPIRELMTNAFDSHQAAGKGGEPFTVIVPSRQDLRFAVRDYGTGMDHETITTLYTTLFASSKEDTNDEVGQLGLGSKSPFAYTDTFTVTAFDGTSKRVYTAFMVSDLPQLALLHEGPSSEPQGILVEFPVKPDDVHLFQTKAAHVAIGFDVRPTIAGGTLDIPRPMSKGDGWQIFKTSHYAHCHSPFSGNGVHVRQGCVIYPLPGSANMTFPVDYNTVVVIDVPIGTADVTLSREALSWDDQTRENMETFGLAAWEDASRAHQQAYDALSGLVEKLRYRDANIPHHWWKKMAVETSSAVPLLPGWGTALDTALQNAKPGHFVRVAAPLGRYGTTNHTVYSLDVAALNAVRIVLLDDVTPRRVTRLRQWGKEEDSYHRRRFYLPVEDQEEARKRIQKVWGLKDDQFIPVADLPDVEREVMAKANPTAKTLLQELQGKLDDGAVWVGTHSRKHEYLTLTEALRPANHWDAAVTKMEHAFTYIYHAALGHAGVEEVDDVLYLSRAQRESLELDDTNELSNVIARYIRDTTPVLVAQKELNDVYDAVHGILRHESRTPVTKALGLTYRPLSAAGSETLRGAGLLGIDTETAETKITEAVELVRTTFPLLFPLDGAELEDYIQKQAATLTTNNQGDTTS